MKKHKKNMSTVRTNAAGTPTSQGQTMSIAQALEVALRHHQAGNLHTAEQIYQQILQLEPANPTALHLLGVVAHQQQRYEAAVLLIGKALAAKPDFADAHSNLGTALRELGRLDDAAASYRKALACNSGFAMAHYNLGNILAAQGKPDQAATCFSNAVKANPRFAEAYLNLGIAHKEQLKLDAAETHYRQALTLRPDWPVALYNLGNTLLDQGNLEEAATCYQRALARQPDYLEARLNLGAVLRDLGRTGEAQACYQQALAEGGLQVDALTNYGALLREMGDFTAAETCYRQALELEPTTALAHFNLGNVLRDMGRLDEAVASFHQAVELSPDCPELYSNLGNTLRDNGMGSEALAVYREALTIDPENVEALINLGNTLKEMKDYAGAVTTYERALALRPDMAETHYNLGTVLQDQYLLDEAVACYRRTLELKANHGVAHSNLLMNLQYDPTMTPAGLLAESLAWEEQQLAGVQPLPPPATSTDPDRPLRVGYVSGDLRRHPVGYFLEGVLAHHDRSQFETFCYTNQSFGDDLTERLRATAGHWRETYGTTDETVAELIRHDNIDILIDLSGHTARNRLLAFGRKPAAVQATWAGYVGTTGLSAMDYLISDQQETPTGTDHWYRETVLRLPDCYVCYTPPDYAPPVAAIPAGSTGHITFGCFNNLAKINSSVIKLWTRLLEQLPTARLLLVTKSLDRPEIRTRLQRQFDPVADRVDLCGMLPHRELLARYGAVDIALDPFPYSGGLTTLEALWMGVPVITLGGERFAARHSLSHLTAVGLPELIAADEQAYLTTALTLADNLPHLAALRTGLRDRMRSSPLCDCPRFTRNLEAAYRHIWRQWCAGST
jgi:protein O-GlcNAc transferase